MEETFTLPCTECGRDYKTTTPQAPVPQWCARCATKMYEQKPIEGINDENNIQRKD